MLQLKFFRSPVFVQKSKSCKLTAKRVENSDCQKLGLQKFGQLKLKNEKKSNTIFRFFDKKFYHFLLQIHITNYFRILFI